ncbi:DUF3455 domain-containing protein [Paractinoplanes rishiriensis]|uniref:DUF3455 domain-containing protein n=1 Tax=Paractinoplanes rishiriensis TaxID=1050105 RepID=UPI0019444E69|nr:DUF3455 domain-containing protein [Actinoplanes rishiriensis]
MLLAATAAVMGIGGLSFTQTASAEEVPAPAKADTAVGTETIAAPSALQPPPGNRILATYRVQTGVQVYRCDTGVWTFQEPRATLTDSTPRFIRHYGVQGAGGTVVPFWEAVDGSKVSGRVLAQAPSPRPNSIPQLLLEGRGQGGGQLGAVTYIQRLNTGGGVAPPITGCRTGQLASVPYTADYVFWV